MKFQVTVRSIPANTKRGYKREWRWRLRGDNNKIVAEGGEGYGSPIRMVETLRKYVARDAVMGQLLKEALAVMGLDEFGREAKT